MDKHRRRDDSMDIDQPERPSPPSTAYGSPSYSPPELEERTDERQAMTSDDEEEENDEERVARRKVKGKSKASSTDEDEDSDDEEQKEARREAKGKMKASSPDEDDEDDDEEQKAARRKAKGKARAIDENYDNDDDDDDENRPPNPPFAPMRNPLASHPTTAAAEEDTSMTHTSDYGADYSYDDERHFGDADAAMNETLPSPSFSYSEQDENNNNNEHDPFTPSASRNPLSERRGHPGLPPLDARSSVDNYAAMMQGDGGRGRGRGRNRGWGLAWRETVTQEPGGWTVYEDPHPSPTMQLVGEEEEEEVEEEEWEEDEEMGWEVYDPEAWERAGEGAQEQEQEAGRVTLRVPVPSSSSSLSGARGGGESSASSSAKPTSSSDTKVNYELLATHSGSGGGGGGEGEYVRAIRSYKAVLTGNFLSYEKDEVLKVIYRDTDGKDFTLLPLKERASTGRAHTRDFVPADAAAASGNVPSDGKSSGKRGERKGG